MIKHKNTDIKLATFLVLAFFAIPFFNQNDGFLYLAMLIMIWSVFTLGYDIAFGGAGILSFGHAAFFGMGAYGLTWAQINFDLPFSVGLIIGAMLGAIVAIIVTIIGKGVFGLFFALLTLIIAEFISSLMFNQLREYSGGVDGVAGVSRPEFLSIDFFDDANFYWFIFAVFVLVILFCFKFRNSPMGNALQGLKQNSVRVEQIGFSVLNLKLIAMGTSGLISGLAGGLMASLMMYTSPQLLSWDISGDVLIMTLLGGVGTLSGPIMGVMLFELLREFVSEYSDYWHGLVGIIFILSTLFFRKGLAGFIVFGRRN